MVFDDPARKDRRQGPRARAWPRSDQEYGSLLRTFWLRLCRTRCSGRVRAGSVRSNDLHCRHVAGFVPIAVTDLARPTNGLPGIRLRRSARRGSPDGLGWPQATPVEKAWGPALRSSRASSLLFRPVLASSTAIDRRASKRDAASVKEKARTSRKRVTIEPSTMVRPGNVSHSPPAHARQRDTGDHDFDKFRRQGHGAIFSRGP